MYAMQTLQCWLCVLSLFSSAMWSTANAQQQLQVTESSEAFLLVASTNKIQRMSLNGSNVTTLIQDSNGIVAMDYHYRLNLIFWVTDFIPDVKCASLTDGSNVTAMGIRNIFDPAGLAVDWIHDKVYWVDKTLRAVHVYDLKTKETSLVAELGPLSQPLKMKIFPQSNDGWLYMGERLDGIYKVTVDSGERTKIVNTNCPYSLTLDYTTRDLYWLDSCNYQLVTSKLDGSDSHLIPTDYDSYFAYGASAYDGHVFWTQSGPTSFVDCLEMESASQHRVYEVRKTILQDIQVVHPSNQPPIAALEMADASCPDGCLHGNCVQPGLCTCDSGWTGATCDTDVNECQENSGGCQDKCVNSPGSFQCSCNAGRVLAEDQKTCTDKESTTASPPPPPSTPSVPPSTPSVPPSTPSPPPSTPSPPPSTPSVPPSTATPSVPPSTATPSVPPSTPPSTPSPPPPTSSPPASTSSPTTPPSPTPPSTSSIPPSTSSPPSSPLASTSSPTPPTTPSTATPGTDITPRDFTDSEEGLESEEKKKETDITIILIIVLTAVGVIIIVGVTLYFTFLYFKHKHNKTGSYNVQGRHLSHSSSSRPSASSSASEESGTSSVHSSFRDITAQYNRERVLQSVAELGCDGEMRRSSGLSIGDLALSDTNENGTSRDGASTCGLVSVSVHNLDHLTEHS